MSSDRKIPSGQPGPADSCLKYDDFFWNVARFKVESFLFQLPIRPLIDGSEVFASQYGLTGDDKKDNKDTAHILDVIVLDVELSDFVGFLKALMPSMASPFISTAQPRLSKGEWVSTLKLSTLWSFTALRQIAINQLDAIFTHDKDTDENMKNLIEYLGLARAYKVSAWLSKTYEYMINDISNYRPLTLEEAKEIGHDTAHELNAIALRKLQACRDQLSKPSVPWNIVEEINKSSVLSSELDSVHEAEEKYGSLVQGLEEGNKPSNLPDNDESAGDVRHSGSSEQSDVDEVHHRSFSQNYTAMEPAPPDLDEPSARRAVHRSVMCYECGSTPCNGNSGLHRPVHRGMRGRIAKGRLR